MKGILGKERYEFLQFEIPDPNPGRCPSAPVVEPWCQKLNPCPSVGSEMLVLQKIEKTNWQAQIGFYPI